MDMIMCYVPTNYLNIQRRTYLTYDFTCFKGNIPYQNRFTILGYPHNVQMDRKNAVSSVLVGVHAAELTTTMLKPPAKAGGFAPPRG